jgi:hypothetical protein
MLLEELITGLGVGNFMGSRGDVFHGSSAERTRLSIEGQASPVWVEIDFHPAEFPVSKSVEDPLEPSVGYIPIDIEIGIEVQNGFEILLHARAFRGSAVVQDRQPVVALT